jgi:hypothetical protein
MVEGVARNPKRIEYSGTVEASSEAEALSKAKQDYQKRQGGGNPSALEWRVTTSEKEENRIHKSKRKPVQEH